MNQRQHKQTLLIEGLEDEGPGDIVGAIAGETDLSGDRIGNIDIENGTARVEVPEERAREISKELDGGRIGSVEVSVEPIPDHPVPRTIDDADDYVNKWTELVEMEREEEMRQHEKEIRHLSGREREEKGRALLQVSGRDEGEGLSGFLVKFTRNRQGEQLPDTEISTGDLIMVSRDDPLRNDNPTGTVTQVTNYSVTASFDEKPHGFVYGSDLRLDLYVNDITYQRMIDAVKKMKNASGSLQTLRDIFAGLRDPSGKNAANVDYWLNYDLNESQRKAVRHALGTDELFAIHGPPGTGKTTTAVEVIEQYLERGARVLATADSNKAVDNLVEFLAERNVDVVRVGHPARVTEQLTEHTLDYIIQENSTFQRSRKLREEAFEKKDRQDDLTHPSGRWRRGMSDDRIRRLAEENRGSRGVPAEKIKEMAEWLQIQEEVDKLFEEADRLREQATDDVLDQAEVICSTNSTAGSELLRDRSFDVVVIDEATQATEPSCLIPITLGGTVILAGDHRQLPPTIKNYRAAKSGLNKTLQEKLAERHGDRVSSMLSVQYRMHEDIMNFSNQQFYDGRLRADDSVRAHTLSGLDYDPPAEETELDPVYDPENPLVFVNTREIEAPEQSREGSTSKQNRVEADLVCRMARTFLEGGVGPRQLAVISPYDDQVELIDDQLAVSDLEVKTVDGFQGREKEVVIISMTRSNVDGVIGFLEDHRRFNVALTRARRKVVVIGDENTITTDDLYRDFLTYVEGNGEQVVLTGKE